ncbi:MAG TPA: MATE family efflux transporter [Thermoanaerobacterales bacterium]|jgi:putative MATE family efflux protein|nr:MATE family efflux transporter [Thermoanaerobacterales bacterium]
MELLNNMKSEKSLRQKILSLAFPAILENVLHTAVWMVDTAMVGRLSAAALSAVGFGTQVAFALVHIFGAIGIGTSALVARYVGAGQPKDANRVVAQSFLVSTIISVLIAIANIYIGIPLLSAVIEDPAVVSLGVIYVRIITIGVVAMIPAMVMNAALRGAGNTRLPMVSAFIANTFNIIADYVLIFGHFGFPQMGVRGAAIATALAQIIGATITLLYLLMGKDIIKLDLKQAFRVDIDILKQLSRLSLPSCLEEFVHSGSRIVSSIWIASLGTVSLAAHQVAHSAESMSFMPGYGFQVAASTLVGQNLGADRPDEAEKSGWKTMQLAVLFMGAVGLFFLLFSYPLMGLFTNVKEVREVAAICIRIAAFEQPTVAICMSLAGALRGAGDTRGTFKVGIISNYLIRIPSLYLVIFVLKKPINYVWMAIVFQFLVQATLTMLRFKQGIWKKIKV